MPSNSVAAKADWTTSPLQPRRTEHHPTSHYHTSGDVQRREHNQVTQVLSVCNVKCYHTALLSCGTSQKKEHDTQLYNCTAASLSNKKMNNKFIINRYYTDVAKVTKL